MNETLPPVICGACHKEFYGTTAAVECSNHIAMVHPTEEPTMQEDEDDLGQFIIDWSEGLETRLRQVVAYARGEEHYPKDRYVQAIRKIYAAELQTLQQELLAKIPTADVVTTKYGYNSDEKKYGYRIGTAEAVSAINTTFKGVLG